jgi:hypothetical protein
MVMLQKPYRENINGLIKTPQMGYYANVRIRDGIQMGKKECCLSILFTIRSAQIVECLGTKGGKKTPYILASLDLNFNRRNVPSPTVF